MANLGSKYWVRSDPTPIFLELSSTRAEGKWQSIITSDKLKRYTPFDVIYTDTFSEEYGGM